MQSKAPAADPYSRYTVRKQGIFKLPGALYPLCGILFWLQCSDNFLIGCWETNSAYRE